MKLRYLLLNAVDVVSIAQKRLLGSIKTSPSISFARRPV